MQALILGASGRIGRLVVMRLKRDRHRVTALVRDRSEVAKLDGIDRIPGDVRDREAVERAVAGKDVVIAVLGPRTNGAAEVEALETGMRNLVAAMEALGVRRLIALSGAGITVPGEDKPLIDRIATRIVRRLAAQVVAAKQREYEVFSGSSLEWTAVRPPLVNDGAPRGYRLSLRLEPGARVTRADVADAIADLATTGEFVREAPFVLRARGTRLRR